MQVSVAQPDESGKAANAAVPSSAARPSATGPLWGRVTVQEFTLLSRAELYRRVKAGTFPKPVALGVRSRAWRAADVQAWLASLQEVK